MILEQYVSAFRDELSLRNYCQRTVKNYCSNMRKFLSEFTYKQSPKEINVQEIKVFVSKIDNYFYRKAMSNAIRTYYRLIYNAHVKAASIPLPRKEFHLPKVIDHDLLVSKIMSIQNKKHKAILALAYSCGLRVSEVVSLKMSDIVRSRMIIRLIQAKGKKDGEVKMSETLLSILEDYYRNEFDKPKIWLFEGWAHKQYSARSCQQIIKKYIDKNQKFHNLRHSCITRLIETGNDIAVAKQIARHASIKTTLIYTHISKTHLQKVVMPI